MAMKDPCRRGVPMRAGHRPALARLLALVVLAGVSLAGPAFAQDAGPAATLVPLEAVDGAIPADVGSDLPLAVVRRLDDAGVAGAHVDWSIAGPEGASVSPARSTTSSAADADGAGVARTRFRAKQPGHYTVTASSLVDDACVGDDCARLSAAFEVEVAGAMSSESESSGLGRKLLGGLATIGGAAALLGAGGGSHDESTSSGAGQTLVANTGSGQSALPNAPLPGLFSVHASNDGRDAAGVTITWSVSGGATLSATTTVTNAAGLAGVFVTSVGPGPAPIVVTATRADSGASVSFSAVVLTPELQQVSGNGQSAPTDTTVPSPLVVRALLGGSPQAGLPINWTVTSGDATIASVSNGGATDASGLSSAVIDLGPTPGTVVVTAARSDFPAITQTFFINATLTRTLTIVSGDGQTAPPNAPLPAPLVVNAQNNGIPIAGVTINWTATGGATPSSGTSVTDGAGNASFTVTSTGPGPAPIQVTATRADDPTASVFFNANILPPQLTIFAGDGQSGFINMAATTPLEVTLLDGAGQPVAGQPISWQVLSGSALLGAPNPSTTDAAGHASITFSYGANPGPITIRASAYGGTQTVDFTATAQGPTGVVPGTGNGATGNPGDAIPLTVQISGPPGQTDLSGVTVFWTVTSGTGSVSPTTSVTDVSGTAGTTLTLGLTPGTVTVVAQVQGGGSTTFTVTINGTLVGTALVIVSGDGQTLSTGVTSAPMVVELQDSGTPLPGMTITWTTNNGTVASFTSTTDALGRASNTVTPGAGGTVQVTASFAAVAQYTASSTTFNHNAAISSVPTLTTDEAAVAVALDNACGDLSSASTLTPEEQDLLNQCLALGAASGVSQAAVADAISEMLPDVAQTQTQTGQTASTAQSDNIVGRMATLRSGGGGNSFGGLALAAAGGRVSLGNLAQSLMAGEDAPAAGDDAGFSRWGVFASGTIGRGQNAAGDNVPSYDFDIDGLTLGVDYRKTDSLILGGAIGYSRQDTKLDDGQGALDMHGFSFSAYASWYLQNSWYVDGVVSAGRNRFDHRRRIEYSLPLPGGGSATVDTQARADSDGTDRSLTLTFGRDFHKDAWGGGAYGRVLYSRLGFGGFEEEVDAGPGSGLGLRVDSRSVTALSTVLGGKVQYTYSTDWGVLMPQAQLEWQKEHKSDPGLFRAFLIDDPTGTPILVSSEPLDSSYFRLGLGLSMVMTHGRSGFVLYERMLARDGMDMDNLSLGFRWEF
jgi:outer membrane autotransporter protein